MIYGKYVLAINQGTTSTRYIIFSHEAEIIAASRMEYKQTFPEEGWVKHDAQEIWTNTRRAASEALTDLDLPSEDVEAIGITDQHETTIVQDKNTDEPIYNAVVWQDTRTSTTYKELMGDEGPNRWHETMGLRINSYPTVPKVRWILDNVEGTREKAEAGSLLFGTIDTWLL